MRHFEQNLESIQDTLEELDLVMDAASGGFYQSFGVGSEVKRVNGCYAISSFLSEDIEFLNPKSFFETVQTTEKEFGLNLFSDI